MFEEVCLQCGKHLKEEGRTYCSDECRYLDTTSPVVSRANSAFSSPHISHAVGGDVPALVPHALSTAIQNYTQHGRDQQSMSSSSASSTFWSASTDDDDGAIHSDYSVSDDPLFEGSSSACGSNLLHTPHNHSLMHYARRPSGINKRSMVPHPHQRSSSGSLSEHGARVRSVGKSAPIRLLSPELSSADEDDIGENLLSGSGYLGGHAQSAPLKHKVRQRKPPQPRQVTSDQDQGADRHGTITRTKRSRNRASLPAYFSLLQVGSPSPAATSPVTASTSISSRASLMRASCSPTAHSSKPSPPTPKISHAVAAPSMVRLYEAGQPRAKESLAMLSSTRPRSDMVDENKPHSLRTEMLKERSRSRAGERTQDIRRFDSRASLWSLSTEKAEDGVHTHKHAADGPPSDLLRPRGRATLRRNSSPPPKMEPITDEKALFSEHTTSRARSTSQYLPCKRDSRTASPPRMRGRARVNELDDIGASHDAPGFGHGRSGLLDRERRMSVSRRVHI